MGVECWLKFHTGKQISSSLGSVWTNIPRQWHVPTASKISPRVCRKKLQHNNGYSQCEFHIIFVFHFSTVFFPNDLNLFKSSATESSVGGFAWLIGGALCFFGCFPCACIPCCVDDCMVGSILSLSLRGFFCTLRKKLNNQCFDWIINWFQSIWLITHQDFTHSCPSCKRMIGTYKRL